MAEIRSYFPEILKQVRQFEVLHEVENPQVQALWEENKRVLQDIFLLTANEYGISRREKMLCIFPMGGDTLEERRYRLLARYNETIPFTERTLHSMLNALCGDKGYKIDLNVTEFALQVKVELENKKNFEAVKELLERVVPLCILLIVELIYNQWSVIGKRKWKEIRSYSWELLKEEVFKDE